VAFLDDVDFVAAPGSVLLLPKFPVSGIYRQSLRIAVTIRPDLGSGSGFVGKRIIRGRCAIGGYPHDLAQVVIECLCHVAISEVLSVGCKQGPVHCLDYSAAEVISMRGWAVLAVYALHISQPRHLAVIEPRAGKRRPPAAVEWLGVRKVDRAVLGEFAVKY